MTSQMEELLRAARRAHQSKEYEAAERDYASAADLARAESRPMELAHALRHLSDLARKRGSLKEAIAAASEAVRIYRTQRDLNPLQLANALRLLALSLEEAGSDRDVQPLWNEARELYQSAGVSAGVDEAQRHLDDAGQAT